VSSSRAGICGIFGAMETRFVYPDDCIAALATPFGESALAVIRTSGAGSIESLAKLTENPESLEKAGGNTMVFGYLKDPDTSEQIDQVMFGIFRAPKSYTGEDSVEMYCHGSIPGIDRILQTLFSHGFRQAQGGEFTLRAFLNGKMDLTQAEAVHELVTARTRTAQHLALGRLKGSIYHQIDGYKKLLIRVQAGVSIQLDYPDDEVEEIPWDFEVLDRIQKGLETLLASYSTGRLFQEGVVVALAGRTNAGKSSLFNLFLKEDRSIVSAIPGTTRDYIEAPLSLKGVPVKLYDTAGLRVIEESIEQEGIRRTTQVMGRSDCILYLVDGTQGLTPEDEEQLATWEQRPLIRVWNKIDAEGVLRTPAGFLPLSATTGEGFSSLEDRLYTEAVKSRGAGLEGTDAVIDSARQKRCLEDTLGALADLQQGIAQRMPLDALALDLQRALGALGEITGEVTREDILDAMFSGFCVGK